MAKRILRTIGDEILRKKSKEVNKYDKALKSLLEDMAETMDEADGVGLAAVQVGVLKRVAIVRTDDTLYEFINPEIIEADGSQIMVEACLSIPGEAGGVERPQKIKVKANDRDGNSFILEADDFLAVVVSHELDHLDGVLFTDKVIPDEELIDADEYEDNESIVSADIAPALKNN